MKKIIFSISLLFFAAVSLAQEAQPYIKKSFVIVQSTKNYAAAKLTAEKAARQLQQPLDFRELKPNKKTGLTFADSVCENEGGYPCYIARGRFDDGDYVSIEWSNAINGFAKGYYVVIVGAGSKDETTIVLKKVKKFFKEAYIKQAEVYIGCMH
ncbi:hypothetical protein [Ferruginibacter sp.]|nr:hypothetical protein [Ferruginibacter sp.]